MTSLPQVAAAFAAYERCQKNFERLKGRKQTHLVRHQAWEARRCKVSSQRWVTRRNLHIDRLASAWLIKQFIDKRPRFYFVAEGETIEARFPLTCLELSSLITGRLHVRDDAEAVRTQ